MPNKLTTAIEDVVRYLYPDVKRGPAYDEWLRDMKTLAGILDWPNCDSCDGLGRTDKSDCCSSCYGIGKSRQ